MSRQIHVFGDWLQLGEVQRMGLLRADHMHGRETFSFEYDPTWLASGIAMSLDPELHLYEGPQYSSDSKPNFGLFLDSSPDRWGRLLMGRREAMDARRLGQEPRPLRESDYLLGVHDEQRMGGLRFKETLNGPFLSDQEGMTVPPWARLRELENAAWNLQSNEARNEHELCEWMRLLLAPGSSLGGARPKAGVCDEQGSLWIAKFPGRNDEMDVGIWEMLVHRLAQEAVIDVADAMLEQFGRSHHTFMSKRFDRALVDGGRVRQHFASAMTMLGYRDGTSFQEGASYLEIVDFITRHGADVHDDLEQLWRRIVFSICVCNTDDHLRNHGFLLEPGGWKLSPAYDINPSPYGTGLHLNISEYDNSLSLQLAMEVAECFRLNKEQSQRIVGKVSDAVRKWPTVAKELGIPRSEQERMRRAFRFAEE